MSWAIRLAVKTLVVGVGLAGTLAALSGKDSDSPQAQLMADMRSADTVCRFTPMPSDQCHCIVTAMADKTPMEMLELQNMAADDPRKQEMIRVVTEKCGHLVKAG